MGVINVGLLSPLHPPYTGFGGCAARRRVDPYAYLFWSPTPLYQ